MSFVAVILSKRSVVPDRVKVFATHIEAEKEIEALDPESRDEMAWEKWENCWVYGYEVDGIVPEPIAALYSE